MKPQLQVPAAEAHHSVQRVPPQFKIKFVYKKRRPFPVFIEASRLLFRAVRWRRARKKGFYRFPCLFGWPRRTFVLAFERGLCLPNGIPRLSVTAVRLLLRKIHEWPSSAIKWPKNGRILKLKICHEKCSLHEDRIYSTELRCIALPNVVQIKFLRQVAFWDLLFKPHLLLLAIQKPYWSFRSIVAKQAQRKFPRDSSHLVPLPDPKMHVSVNGIRRKGGRTDWRTNWCFLYLPLKNGPT